MEKVNSHSHVMKRFIFHERIILNTLSKMKKGHLTIIMPDGRSFFFGEKDEQANNPAIIEVLNPLFFKKCFWFGDIGFGEAYVDGLWRTDSIKKVIQFMIMNIDHHPALSGGAKKKYTSYVKEKFFNTFFKWSQRNTTKNRTKNIQSHYDLSDDFFKLMLDESMAYSAAIFSNPESTLEEAQRCKYRKICEKLQLKESDCLLEIGSGWGGMAIYAAQNYGCRVESITISKKQLIYAQNLAKKLNLSHLVQFKFLDFTKLLHIKKKYNKILSIEMIEAIGDGLYEKFFKVVENCLAPDGLMLLQAITCADHRYKELKSSFDWIQKYIFPGSLLPCVSRLIQAANNASFLQLFSLEDIGIDYAKTLKIWHQRFLDNLTEVKNLGFDQRFINIWNYYLEYCYSAFVTRHISDIQILFTRSNNLTLER
jgi:cyclopropane-fatty-acyl-phospholipid synthase